MTEGVCTASGNKSLISGIYYPSLMRWWLFFEVAKVFLPKLPCIRENRRTSLQSGDWDTIDGKLYVRRCRILK